MSDFKQQQIRNLERAEEAFEEFVQHLEWSKQDYGLFEQIGEMRGEIKRRLDALYAAKARDERARRPNVAE